MPLASPKEVGFSEERLARIRPAMQKYIDDGKVPNLVTLVARRGHLVHFDAQGYMDIDTREPAERDTLFRLYSNTKPITGVATMILFEEGLLTLDDPISRYIPAFENLEVRLPDQPLLTEPARREITIRDCLAHTSGLATQSRAPLQYRTLYRDVMENTASAASHDPRFPSMTVEEADPCTLELSVMTPLRRITDPADIEVGRHGLLVSRGSHSGLLLPQVGSERGWTAIEFLENTCLKAGLQKHAWNDDLSEIQVFEADVFGE